METVIDVLPVEESHAKETDHHRIIMIGRPPVVKVGRHSTGVGPQGVVVVKVGEYVGLTTSLSANSQEMFIPGDDHSRQDSLKDLHRPVIRRLLPQG